MKGEGRVGRSLMACIFLLGILLAGFGLRIHALEAQSMWSDEGLSLYRARQPLLENLQNTITVDGIDTQDTNPPLYFVLLHGWRSLAGESVFALRYVGSLAGFLAVPLLYVLGAGLYGRNVGLVAALLMALAPFHVWQSQVLRNYGLLVTLNLLSVYGLLRFVMAKEPPRWRWLLLWAVAGLLGIYTHYFAFFVFAFGLLALAISAAARAGVRQLLGQRSFWLVLLLLILILLPVVPAALERFNAGQQIDFHRTAITDVLAYAAGAFSVGMSPTLRQPWLLAAPALLLASLGLVLGWQRRRVQTLFLLGYQLLPLALLLLLSLWNPLFNGTRHLLIGLPPFLLFTAAGAVMPFELLRQERRRRARVVLALAGGGLATALLVIQLFWLGQQFNSPALVRDDVRGAAQFLADNATAEDVIVLHDTLIKFTFDYYYDGVAPVTAVPAYGEQNVEAAREAFLAATSGAERLWFLASPTPRTGFPRESLLDWAETRWPRTAQISFPRMWLELDVRGYMLQLVQDSLPATADPLRANFADTLSLHGVTLPPAIQAGEPALLTLYMSRAAAATPATRVTLRFEDTSGQEWQQSHRRLWDSFPPQEWPVDALIRYDHEVDLAAGLPPGGYTVWLRLENRDAEPLRTEAGAEEVYLGEVSVIAGNDSSKLPAHTPQRARRGPLALLGFDHPQEELRPGHVLPLDLFWQVKDVWQRDLAVRVELVDPDGRFVTEAVGPVTRPDAPPASWQAGDIIQSKVNLVVPATAVPEPHRLRLSLIDPQSGRALGRPVMLDGTLPVDTWPLITEFPAMGTPLRADFGRPPAVELHGYDLAPQGAAPGEDLELALYWRAVTTLPTNYNVFVHLVDAEGRIVAQGDGPPLAGFRPTVSWRPGEVFVDEHTITLPEDLQPGTYRLWTGLYDADTGERLPAVRDGESVPGGAVVLQEVIIR